MYLTADLKVAGNPKRTNSNVTCTYKWIYKWTWAKFACFFPFRKFKCWGLSLIIEWSFGLFSLFTVLHFSRWNLWKSSAKTLKFRIVGLMPDTMKPLTRVHHNIFSEKPIKSIDFGVACWQYVMPHTHFAEGLRDTLKRLRQAYRSRTEISDEPWGPFCISWFLFYCISFGLTCRWEVKERGRGCRWKRMVGWMEVKKSRREGGTEGGREGGCHP